MRAALAWRRRPRVVAAGVAAATVVAAAALGLTAAPSALAHAQVRSTEPAQGAALKSAPTRVVFRFSENVETQFGAVRVFDSKGKRVDAGPTTRPSGDRAAVALDRGLPDGAYTATYHVISADSHPVSGGFTFTVGRAGGQSAASVASLVDKSNAGPGTSIPFGFARGLGYAATALLAGGALFLWLVWLPALRELAGAQERWRAASEAVSVGARRAGLIVAAVGVLASVAGIVLQGATAAGISIGAALKPGVTGDVLATDFGLAWVVRLVAFAGLGAVVALAGHRVAVPALRPVSVGAEGLALPRAPRPVVALAALGIAVLAITPAFAGHANATSPRGVMLALDVLHVGAMSAWVGGVAFMVVLLPRATRTLEGDERTRVLAQAVARFSPIALVAVAVLLASGIVQSITHLSALSELWSSGYGRGIAIKSIVVIALIGAGAHNRQRVLPQLRAAAAGGNTPGRIGLHLRRAIRGEVALMAVAIGVTAVFVSYAPPATQAAGPASIQRDLGPARLEMTVAPARVGRNEIHLYLFDRRSGAQYDKSKQVTVTATLASRRIGPLELDARKTGPGHYTVTSASLVPGGEWTLGVTSRVSEFDEYTTRGKVDIR